MYHLLSIYIYHLSLPIYHLFFFVLPIYVCVISIFLSFYLSLSIIYMSKNVCLSIWASQVVLVNAGDVRDSGSIPGCGRSPGEGNGNPPQNSRLENPMGRGAWRAAVHGVAKSWTRLSD